MDNQTTQQPPQPPPYANAPPSRGPHYRSPFIAGFLSAVPGLGNVYNGLYQRGITFFVIVTGLFGIAVQTNGPELGFIVPTMLFFWLFNIFDAYRQATLINYGYTESQLPKLPIPTSGGLMLGVTVFLVGLYGLLREVFDFDFSVIFDYWYLGFLGFGAWLIREGLRQKKDDSAIEDHTDLFHTSPPNGDEDDAEASEAA